MDSTLEALGEWMPRQRWYAGKGSAPVLRLVAEWDLGSFEGGRVSTLLVSDASSANATLYQVPVVERADGGVDPAGLIGRRDGRVVIDGTTDSAYQGVLLAWLQRGGGADGADGPLTARPEPGVSESSPMLSAQATVLGGEQSNTSIVFRSPGFAPVICKVFRQVSAGLNPDIEVQTALSEAGAAFVPPSIATISGTWREPAGDGPVVTGSLAFAQEFFEGVEDAWRVALVAAAGGEDFADRAEALGAAVAGMHERLAVLFPTVEATPERKDAAIEVWRRRLDLAVAEVPALETVRAAVESAYARAAAEPWAPLQRIHGDLHLGQVLDVPVRGWVLLDFEGEPLRPIAERVAPDSALRDVAGMLRSFDYVAGSVSHGDDTHADAGRWAAEAREGFARGYRAETGQEMSTAQLRAFELDKAVYEVVYEARNRPDWLDIPLTAVRRLAAS